MYMISFSHNHPKVVHSDDAVAAAADVPTPAVTAALTRGVLSYIKNTDAQSKMADCASDNCMGFLAAHDKEVGLGGEVGGGEEHQHLVDVVLLHVLLH